MSKKYKNIAGFSLGFIAAALGSILAFAILAYVNLSPYIYRPVQKDKGKRAGSAKVTVGKGKEAVKRPVKLSTEDYIQDLRWQYSEAFLMEVPEFEVIVDKDGNEIGYNEKLVLQPIVKVPENLHLITGLDKTGTYYARIDAADALGKNLSKEEINALLAFLHKRIKNDHLKNLEFNAVKNQVTMALMRQNSLPEALPRHLIAMYLDNQKLGLDLTWRDYCIQFLGQVYPMIGPAEDTDAARKILYDATAEENGIAGAAIIALEGLTDHPGFNPAIIAGKAYSIAANDKVPDSTRVPALQIAAKYGHPKAYELAVATVTKAKTVQLKMSAIAAIGMLGSKDDVKMLSSYRLSSDVRLRMASKAALKKLGYSKIN